MKVRGGWLTDPLLHVLMVILTLMGITVWRSEETRQTFWGGVAWVAPEFVWDYQVYHDPRVWPRDLAWMGPSRPDR